MVVALAIDTERAQRGLASVSRLVRLAETTTTDCLQCYDSFSYATFDEWNRLGVRGLDTMTVFGESSFILVGSDRKHIVQGAFVRHDLFGILGVRPVRGRPLLPDDGLAEPAVLVSYRFWQRYLGGDPAAIGKPRLSLSDGTFVVVGVMPRGFNYPAEADLWFPLPHAPKDFGGYFGLGRLAPRFTASQVSQGLRTLAANQQAGMTDRNAGRGAAAVAEAEFQRLGRQSPLLLVAGVVVLSFFVACLNFASAFLARAVSRERELAIRVALGATGEDLARLLALESMIVALGAGVLAVGVIGLSAGTVSTSLSAAFDIPLALHLDWHLLAILCLCALFTAIVLAAIPVIHSLVRERRGGIRLATAGSTPSIRTRRLHSSLVVIQTSAVVVVAAGAVMLLDSLKRIRTHDLGFDASRVVATELTIRGDRYSSFASLEPRVAAALREVRDAEPSSRVTAWAFTGTQRADDAPSFVLEDGEVRYARGGPFLHPYPFVSVDVTPEFFDALGIRIVQGRAFTATDNDGAEFVTVVNQMVAESFWPAANPLGRRFKLGPEGSPGPWVRVVGVSENGSLPGSTGLSLGLLHGRRDFPLMFRPLSQTRMLSAVPPYRMSRRLTFAASGSQTAQARLVHELEGALLNSFEDQVVTRPSSLAELMQKNGRVGAVAALAAVLTAMTGITVLLAMVGVASVAMESVARRTREFGVRMALGAQRVDIARLILAASLRIAAVGAISGLAITLWVRFTLRHTLDGWSSTMKQGLLFGIPSTGLRYYVLALSALLVVVTAASLWPALRAANVQPVRALRAD